MEEDGDGGYSEIEKQYIELAELSKLCFTIFHKEDLLKLLKKHNSDRGYSLV